MPMLSKSMLALLRKAMRASPDGVRVSGREYRTAEALHDRGLGFHFRPDRIFYVRPALRELVKAVRRGGI
jgi:hypothetical protein